MSIRSRINPRSVSIIIPQMNQPDLTIEAIRTLRRADPIRWPLLVVDNGSSPDSRRQLHGLRDPNVEILTLPIAGLTAAWNAAARHSRADYLIFLNNDTVTRGAWVEALLAPLSQGTSLITGVALRRESLLAPPIDLLAGWCFALCRQTFDAVHEFDPSMQLYFSDTDLQLRVREEFSCSSIPIWTAVPGLPITHLSHRTAHRLPHQRSLWLADREKFLARWQECR